MPELLLELGCEELPASFVEKAFNQLRDEIVSRLDASLLTHGEALAYGTPRRLIAVVRDVSERQPDTTKEQRGPSLAAAYDADGNPTKALEGFCRSQSVEPSQLRKDEEYVWVTKHLPGRPAAEVLADILPESIKALSFEKSMRWGAGGMRFARPIRWIVALLGGVLVLFDIEGVSSGSLTRGHRFLAPDDVQVRDFETLCTALRAGHVEFDPVRRRQMIVDGANALVSGGDVVDADEAILDENVYLTEWPMPSLGKFDEQYLSLPTDVLTVAMKKHEKFLPIRDVDGKLTNRFISVRNGGDEVTVTWGNEWVLGARFNDAKFFFDEDSKHPLTYFAEKLDRIVFQEKLGTVAQKAERLSRVASDTAALIDPNPEWTDLARRAAVLCKADLACGLVSELPSLQGIIGGEYARRDGEHDSICWAVRTHYNPTEPPDCEGSKLARVLMAADRIDTLVGYLGLGLIPSGSSDPFGLRRAMHMLLLNDQAGWDEKFPPFDLLTSWSLRSYAEQGHVFEESDVRASVRQLAVSRYEVIHADVRHDILDAVLGSHYLQSPSRVASRVRFLQDRSLKSSFTNEVRTATRAGNIVNAAEKKGITPWLIPGDAPVRGIYSVDLSLFETDEERHLYEIAVEMEGDEHYFDAEDEVGRLYTLLNERLSQPVNSFFDTVMVMVEETAVRDNRLKLLAAVAHKYLRIADFSKIVIEG